MISNLKLINEGEFSPITGCDGNDENILDYCEHSLYDEGRIIQTNQGILFVIVGSKVQETKA